MKAKGKKSPLLWLILIILCSKCSLFHPLWFYSSAYCRWMVLAEHGSSRRWTNPYPYLRDRCAWLPALCAVYFSGHEHDARGVFMSMHRGISEEWHMKGTITSGYGRRSCQQAQWQSRAKNEAVRLELTSANKSLFHAAATVYIWFTLWWTSERDLWTYKAVAQAATSTTGTAQEGHDSALNSEPL